MSRLAQHDNEKGQALVEFALTVPILLMFVFGIIDVARVLFGLSQVVDASRQAVRFGLVEGLNASDKQYLDCQGIQDAALNLPGIVNLTDATVSVYYEDVDGAKIADCSDDLTNWDVTNGDVLAVRVQGGIRPVTPVLMAFTDNISFSYTSRRTIVSEGAPFTDKWPEPPPRAENFRAVADCSKTSDNVSFYWDFFRLSLTGPKFATRSQARLWSRSTPPSRD